jgi:ABC-type transporter Mla subunit MlaD
MRGPTVADIWARVDEAIDTDPLQFRGIVAELLARAEHAEGAAQVNRERANEFRQERDALKAAMERVRRAVVDVYGEDYAGEDAVFEVERLFRHLAEHETNVQRILQAKNGAIEQAEAERDALKAAIETGEVARFAVDVHRLVADYSNEERGLIALAPFEATLDQLCLERYGFDLDRAASESPAAASTVTS